MSLTSGNRPRPFLLTAYHGYHGKRGCHGSLHHRDGAREQIQEQLVLWCRESVSGAGQSGYSVSSALFRGKQLPKPSSIPMLASLTAYQVAKPLQLRLNSVSSAICGRQEPLTWFALRH